MEASTAYDNIINAIKAAEEAANKAGTAADSALSVSTHKQPNNGTAGYVYFYYQRGTKIKELCVLACSICLWPLYEEAASLLIHVLVLLQH